MNRFYFALSVVFGLLLSANCCLADGFIIIHNPPPQMVPGHFAFAPLEVTYHHVTVSIEEHTATTTVDQEFYNPNPQNLEGTYIFPLPSGAHIDKFSMDVNGAMMDAELLSADKARSLYEEVVRKYRDPALLEYSGRDAFKVRIFPIQANSRKKVKITYTELLKSDAGLVEYTYPLNTEKFSARPLQNVSMKIELASDESLKSVYSPTHNVDIRRDGDKHAVIGWEAKDVRPDTDFKLIFSRSKQAVGVDLLTYRQGSEDGYFLLLASPGLEAPKGVVQKKDLCFILDTSGSMAGAKIEQAKKALSFCVNSLNETDRFEVIRFSTECEPLFSELRPASKQNVGKALDFVKDLKAIGGTAIQDALHQALTLKHDDARPYELVFLTDGEPTIGETNEDALVAQATKESGGNTRVFCFGLGNDVNTHLLERIATDTRAFTTYVAPEEDIEIKVSNFYTKIKEPVLGNVQLTFTGDGIRTSQLYPGTMPDLFKGEVLTAFGRYHGSGPSAVQITGTINGEKQTFVTDVRFAEQDTKNAYIPRLWAARRVGYLLDQIRLHGQSNELRDEVTRLARDWGIVTPYTAYLIIEDERRRNVPLSMQNFRELESDKPAFSYAGNRLAQINAEAKGSLARTGEQAVAAARDVGALKDAQNLDQAAASPPPQFGPTGALSSKPLDKGEGGPMAMFGLPGGGHNKQANSTTPTTQPGYHVASNYAQQARVVKGRAFYQNGSVWTDSTAQNQSNIKQKNIAFNSDEYFDLLKNHPQAAEWFALGTEVDIVLDDTLYIVR